MSDPKGEFKADIPADVIADALRSVEARERGETPDEEEVTLEPETTPGQEPEDEKVRTLRALLEESTSRAAQTSKRLEETHERFVRVSADFDNFRKRAQREREEVVKFGNEKLLKDLLPVVDNLERAIAAGGADGEGLLAGLRMVHKSFLEVLTRNGVVGFDSVGEPFDPSRHEALMQQESAEVPSGTVLSELHRGYLLNDKLVRPAAVVVSKTPSANEG